MCCGQWNNFSAYPWSFVRHFYPLHLFMSIMLFLMVWAGLYLHFGGVEASVSIMLLLPNSCGYDELSLTTVLLKVPTGSFYTVESIEINSHFVSEVKKERAYYWPMTVTACSAEGKEQEQQSLCKEMSTSLRQCCSWQQVQNKTHHPEKKKKISIRFLPLVLV